MTRPTLIDLQLFAAPAAVVNRYLYRVGPVPLVDDEFYVFAESRTDVERAVLERAQLKELPLIWREIEAL